MDGLDISIIEDLLNGSPIESEEEDYHQQSTNCIGTNSMSRDPQPNEAKNNSAKTRVVKRKSRSERERELELKLLNPYSIRTQILKQSLIDARNGSEQKAQKEDSEPTDNGTNPEIPPTTQIEPNLSDVAPPPVECDPKNPSDEDTLWSEMVTQEKRIADDLDEKDQASQQDNNTTLRRKASEPVIDSFFRKKSKGSAQPEDEIRSSEEVFSPVEKSNNNDSNQYLSQEDDDEFFDAVASECTNEPHDHQQPIIVPQIHEESPVIQPAQEQTIETSQHEEPRSVQNVLSSDDFQCPYCFKLFSDFPLLESHVDRCYLKIPIDVNKQFIPRRSQQSTQEISSYFSRATKLSSQSTSSGRKTRGRRSPNPSSISMSTPSSKSNHRSSLLSQCSTPNSIAGSGVKLSFYQRFIESNSDSLNKSNKIDPLQCPYCQHGFLSFSTLETHVIMCTKQRAHL